MSRSCFGQKQNEKNQETKRERDDKRDEQKPKNLIICHRRNKHGQTEIPKDIWDDDMTLDINKDKQNSNHIIASISDENKIFDHYQNHFETIWAQNCPQFAYLLHESGFADRILNIPREQTWINIHKMLKNNGKFIINHSNIPKPPIDWHKVVQFVPQLFKLGKIEGREVTFIKADTSAPDVDYIPTITGNGGSRRRSSRRRRREQKRKNSKKLKEVNISDIFGGMSDNPKGFDWNAPRFTWITYGVFYKYKSKPDLIKFHEARPQTTTKGRIFKLIRPILNSGGKFWW